MDPRKRRKLSSPGNWSDLLYDLLILVVRKIDSVEDYFAFHGVCASWRLAAAYEDFNSIRRLPWLLQIKNEILELSNPLGRTPSASAAIPTSEIHNCVGCRGWILVVQKNGTMNLVHIMSGVHIKLPDHGKSFSLSISKMVLSSSPLMDPLDYTLVILYGNGAMAYWRPGDEAFSEVIGALVSDVIYHNGLFYVMTNLFIILTITAKRSLNYPTSTLLETRSSHYVSPPNLCLFGNYINYLVESDGDLLLVVRYKGAYDFLFEEQGEVAMRFGVYKIEKLDGLHSRVTEIKNLGNRAMFIGGLNASFSLNATQVPGCKPNHIYFTGHRHYGANRRRYREKYQMGIYSLKDGLVEYSGWGSLSSELGRSCVCHPLWVTPTLV